MVWESSDGLVGGKRTESAEGNDNSFLSLYEGESGRDTVIE